MQTAHRCSLAIPDASRRCLKLGHGASRGRLAILLLPASLILVCGS
jgi:hypothetical protein